ERPPAVGDGALIGDAHRRRRRLTVAGQLVVLSGGLDSTVCMALAARTGGTPPLALSFDYGQRHRTELDRAAGVAGHYRSDHLVVHLDTEARDLDAVWIGVNAIDYSGYPDCRPEFIEAFRGVAATGQKRGVEGNPIELRTPLIGCTKEAIVRLGVAHDAPLQLTWSCYLGGDRPCGTCDACELRARGFAAAGVADPALA